MRLERVKNRPIEQRYDEVPLPRHLVQESGPLPHAPGRLRVSFGAIHELSDEKYGEQDCCHPDSPVCEVLKLPKVVSFEILRSYQGPLDPHKREDNAAVGKQYSVAYFL